MGLNNFAGPPSDDDSTSNGPSNPNSPGNPRGPGTPRFPNVPGMSTGVSQPGDIPNLLIDYTAKFTSADPVLFRDTVIEQSLSVLISKSKPNALLVGPAGVGKTCIVEELARRIAVKDPLIPTSLRDQKIYELPLGALIAGTAIQGSLEQRLQEVIEFASDARNKAIIFIDEIHQLTGSSSSHGSHQGHTISQVLKPALARGDMRVVGATTSTESRAFDADPAFARRFSRIIIDELTTEQTQHVLRNARASLLAHYNYEVTVSDETLDAAVLIADETARAGQHRPDTALTLLDRALADRVLEQKRLLSQAQKSGDTALVSMLQATPSVPLTQVRIRDVAQRLMTGHAVRPPYDLDELTATLHARLQGQDDVIDTLSDNLARISLDAFPRKAPTTWMFAGASGVGKTESAKLISEQLTAAPPIILNMAEFHDASSLSKIVGSPPGYVGSDSNAEMPFDVLESNPYRVILLDEFEKADTAVQRLFLSAFDEGYIKNAHGKMLDFSKALVICTTNAAREALSGPSIGFNSGVREVNNRSLNRALKEHFDAELLGRFSLVIGFNPIDEATFGHIIAAHYEAQRARIIAAQPQRAQVLPVQLSDDKLCALTEEHYIDTQGARPAARAVQALIENLLLDDMKARAAHQAQMAVLHQQTQTSGAGDSSQGSEDS